VRVLVVYGSSRGGTADLGRAVAEALLNRGIAADIGNASSVDDLAGYDAVIVGGALYAGRWHDDAASFVERNLAALRATNVWFFSSGPLDNSASSGSLAPIAHVKELARLTDIRGHMTFGGVLAKPRGLFGSLFAWGKPGDYRDPEQIIIWVDRIVAKFGEPKQSIVLPDAPSSAERIRPSGVLRRLATAGEDTEDLTDDMGLDVLAEVAEG
jgi:menaquinone-dependent protoporphyrinogen oxidase